MPQCHDFLMGPGDLNSSSQACTTGILPTEPFLQAPTLKHFDFH